jgi:hypothetical protein
MNQAQFQMIIWREAPKINFSHNPQPNKILCGEAAETPGK